MSGDSGVVLCVDYGERRLGFAVSDAGRVIAFPYRMAEVRSRQEAIDATIAAASDSGAVEIVVGMPYNMNGSMGAKADEVSGFISSLRVASGMRITEWDERMTTKVAERVLLAADISRRKRTGLRDKLAAQVILQGYLDSIPPVCAGPGGHQD